MNPLIKVWRSRGEAQNRAEVVLGEDWVDPEEEQDSELSSKRARRRLVSINSSPIARKIITFNLLALVVLVAGVLYLNPFRDSLVAQRELSLSAKAQLVAGFFGAAMPADQTSIQPAPGFDPQRLLDTIHNSSAISIYVFTSAGDLTANVEGTEPPAGGLAPGEQPEATNFLTGFLTSLWRGLSHLLTKESAGLDPAQELAKARSLVPAAAAGQTRIETGQDEGGEILFSVATPIVNGGSVVGVVALTSAAGELDALVQNEREQVLQMFFTAILVSIIANPLADLAAAAELGRDRHARKMSPSRVRIPDLTARPDEIGRLSGAMRGMVAALYDRIEGNEQFAADVAHEIKNPLASLRSAVVTLRSAQRDDQRVKLLDVIEHDVRRLDRLISDISNASRLDSELVREDEASFDLLKMLSNIAGHFREEADTRSVEFITDLPSKPIVVQGLEARLAQVFVNLISNAVSFCEAGDAVRLWARRRENRVLVVVEDTGPGIPEQAIQKIFNRFYSERPVGQFGNHSGLGLAISKQIVEAHGGVIWAENIRPTDADMMSEPLGARFVVGLPV
jgi:two-component system sensor histidine kinase ChvG